ncbi:LptF/LptG family permease [Shimia sp. W99]
MRLFASLFHILGLPILIRLLLILAAVEAIFLAESFTTLMEEALRNDAMAADVGVLLVLRMPRIADLALAIGVLIAVYFVVSDARSRGELVILASAGVRWSRIVQLVLILGLLGGAVSFATAGFLSPMARYASRIKMAELRRDHIVSRIEHAGPLESLQTIRDVTFIATPPPDSLTRHGQLFIFQPDVDGLWRAMQARNWVVTDPDDKGQRKIELEDLSAYEGAYPAPARPMRSISTFAVRSADFAFGMSDVTSPPKRERSRAERILDISTEETPRLARVMARALMVPTAALLALAAVVAGGGGLARFVALPLAAVLLMSGDVMARAVVVGISADIGLALTALLSFVVYLAPPLAYLAYRGETLMIPQGRGA